MGKILYVMMIAVLNSVFTFIGLIIAFRLGGPAFGAGEMNFSSLSPSTLAGLFVTLLTMAGLAASIIVLLGSLARNIRGRWLHTSIYIFAVVPGRRHHANGIAGQPAPVYHPAHKLDIRHEGYNNLAVRELALLLMLLSNLTYVSVLIFAREGIQQREDNGFLRFVKPAGSTNSKRPIRALRLLRV